MATIVLDHRTALRCFRVTTGRLKKLLQPTFLILRLPEGERATHVFLTPIHSIQEHTTPISHTAQSWIDTDIFPAASSPWSAGSPLFGQSPRAAQPTSSPRSEGHRGSPTQALTQSPRAAQPTSWPRSGGSQASPTSKSLPETTLTFSPLIHAYQLHVINPSLVLQLARLKALLLVTTLLPTSCQPSC